MEINIKFDGGDIKAADVSEKLSNSLKEMLIDFSVFNQGNSITIYDVPESTDWTTIELFSTLANCIQQNEARPLPNVGLKVDFDLLREQKATLLSLLNAEILEEKQDEHLTGILLLIDHVQDQAAALLGEEKVFGARYPSVGQKFELIKDVERHPNFIAKKGSRGTITKVETKCDTDIYGLMDEPLEGAEEWDNCIIWNVSTDNFFEDAVIIEN